MTSKPRLSFWQIWNMCFGFMGIQFGFALQNSNVSRIFQTLGASVDDIPILWIAAPLTGLLVQPIVGYFSDRTWGRLGRRRPYFLTGAILATLALIAMPNSSVLWIAAGLLWVLDASINISMEPFRAFVGDQLPSAQRPTGYAMQSLFIGAGSVIASLLPWLLATWGVSNTAAAGAIPDTVKYAFYAGAAALFGTIAWTVVSTREYPPETLAAFDDARPASSAPLAHARVRSTGGIWFAAGLLALAVVYFLHIDKQLYLLAGGMLVYGVVQVAVSFSRSQNMFADRHRHARDAGDHARPGCRAVLFLVCAVRDVDLHHGRSDGSTLWHKGYDFRHLQRWRELGRCLVRRL
jgi:maltose/moltooligosaccharide transporter